MSQLPSSSVADHTSSNYPQIPVVVRCQQTENNVNISLEEREENTAEDEEELEDNNVVLDDGNSQECFDGSTSCRRTVDSLDFRQTASGSRPINQSETQHLTQQQLAKVAASFIDTLTDERVEQLIVQIQNGLLAKNRWKNQTFLAHDLPVIENRRQFLEALIRSLGSDWDHFINRSVMDDLKRHLEANVEQRNSSVVVEYENSHSGAAQHLQEFGEERRSVQRRSQRICGKICARLCSFGRSRENVHGNEQEMQSLHTLHDTIEHHDDEITNEDSNRQNRRFLSINSNVFWCALLMFFGLILMLTILIIVFVIHTRNTATITTVKTNVGIYGPTTSSNDVEISNLTTPIDMSESAGNFTERPFLSLPIRATNATIRLKIDYFSHSILVTQQYVNNHSNIETIFYSEFLEEKGRGFRYLSTNERCVAVTEVIICCETFCEGIMKNGHPVTRTFPPESQFCGAWQYEFSNIYICTRQRDKLMVHEFWSKKEYLLMHDSLNAEDFQAIDLLPVHVAVLLTKNSSNTDQLCITRFGKKGVKEVICRDVGFLGLQPMDISMTRHIVYLQHNNTWAVVTSKLDNNYLQWTINVFKGTRLIFRHSKNLFSVDNQLVVFGESPIVKVCAIELNINREKVISCTAYTFEI